MNWRAGATVAELRNAAPGQIGAPLTWIDVDGPPRERIMLQRTRDGQLVLTPNEAFFPAGGLIATGEGRTPDVDNLNGGRSFTAIAGWRPGRVAEWGVYCEAAGKASVRVLLSAATGQDQFTLRAGTAETRLAAETGDADSRATLVGDLMFQHPGPQTVQLICRRASDETAVQRIELAGPATAGGGVMRQRWRPTAAHAKFSSSRLANDIRLWVMELDAAPGTLDFYSPVTTPFGYYGPAWRADGTVGAGFNFSLWSFRRNQREPATEKLSHLLAVGHPTAEFGGFDHEGTGVKVRNWEPLAGRQEQRQAIALRVEPGPRYDTYYSYFYEHDKQRWRFFATGAKANNGRPLRSLWVGSFVEVPGPPQRQRTGVYPRTMRYRGWVCDAQGSWAPLDQMTYGDVDRNTGLTPTARGVADDGRFWLSAGGWTFRKPPAERFVTLAEAAEIDDAGYLDGAAQEYLSSQPVRLACKKVRLAHGALTGAYELHGASEPMRIDAFWGTQDGVTFASRWTHRDELPAPKGLRNSFTIADVPAGSPIYVRLLVTCPEGKYWSHSTLAAHADSP